MPDSPQLYATVRDDFFSARSGPLAEIRLAGTICRACGEPSLGVVPACQACQSTDLAPATLSRDGTLYSYTVVRNRPPGDFKGKVDPFVPYPVGLVELPEGIRVLSVLDCPVDAPRVGMSMTLDIHELYREEDGTPVIAFRFRPSAGENR
jgi:uncharacterized OB-fold protein